MSAQLTWRALDEAGEARTTANRPAFPLKLLVGLATCANAHTVAWNLFSKWRFRLRYTVFNQMAIENHREVSTIECIVAGHEPSLSRTWKSR